MMLLRLGSPMRPVTQKSLRLRRPALRQENGAALIAEAGLTLIEE